MTDKITSIRVRQSTRDALGAIGERGESMEDIIRRLLQSYDERITFEKYK